jgi:hypothetical protein
MAHLIDDETVAKMGHPVVVVRSDVGHPSCPTKKMHVAKLYAITVAWWPSLER